MTPRDNFFNFFTNKEYEWIPTTADEKYFYPEMIPENIARGFVIQQKPFPREKFGGNDWFGIHWTFYPEAAGMGGSMEDYSLFDDANDWKEYVKFPDLSKLDWAGCAEENKEYLKTDKILSSVIFTGFFERLISFMGFEDAAAAMVDEDQQDSVKELFDHLADFYVELMGYMKDYFNVELIDFHDDWGSQRAPIFSPATHTEMILPYMQKVTSGAREKGVLVMMHSCGFIEPLIPNLIKTGVITWRGQELNDKKKLVEQYGDQFTFDIFVPFEPGTTFEEIFERTKQLKETYKDKKVKFSFPRFFTPEQIDKLAAVIQG